MKRCGRISLLSEAYASIKAPGVEHLEDRRPWTEEDLSTLTGNSPLCSGSPCSSPPGEEMRSSAKESGIKKESEERDTEIFQLRTYFPRSYSGRWTKGVNRNMEKRADAVHWADSRAQHAAWRGPSIYYSLTIHRRRNIRNERKKNTIFCVLHACSSMIISMSDPLFTHSKPFPAFRE